MVNGEDRLNDPLEVTHAIEEMRRTWQHYRGSSQLVDDVPREDVDDLIDYLANEIESMDLFFTSGSTTGDKLEHWKGYGSDQGYSICFQDCSRWRIRSQDETPSQELEPTSPFLRWREVDYTKFEPFFGRPLVSAGGRALEEIIRSAVGRRDGSITEQAGRKYALDEALRQLCWHKHTGYESEEEIRIAVLNPPPGTRRTRKSAYGPRNVEYVELVAGDPMDPGATILAAGEPVPHLPIMAVRVDRGTLRPSWRRTSMPQHAFSTRTDTTFPCSRHRRPSSGVDDSPWLPGERPLNGGHSAAGERR
ncbi:hypothetical protein GS432_16830 [Rhodococcus hoagii]|nr:hypothetical protein [Prescottella equi]